MMAAVRADREPLDELALRRAQRGDQRAWRELIERYEAQTYALIWRLLAGRAQHRAEDLVQETFVRVLRALPSFNPAGPASLSTWILTIATRLTLSELRRPDALPLEAAPQVVAPEQPAASLERQRLGAAIAAAVAALPESQRAVFVLREYHELDYAEIAQLLEIDLGTVRSRLSRARAAVREHLGVVMPELGGAS